MPSTPVYPIPGLPTVFVSEEGQSITIRPMLPADGPALLEFFQRIPEEDRFYLKEDVTSPRIVEGWAETLDYNRTLPLLAEVDGQIIGDGTLHLRRAGSRSHIAEVRILIDPQQRQSGIGRVLLHNLVNVAAKIGLSKLMFEVIGETEEAARHTALILGFVPVARLPLHVKDSAGKSHDLVIMEMTLSGSREEEHSF